MERDAIARTTSLGALSSYLPAPGTLLLLPPCSYASGLDLRGRGFLSSMSRYLRTSLNLDNCQQYPWPPKQWWSPAYTDGQYIQPTGAFKALKRAENYQAAVLVEMSQLSGSFDAVYGMANNTCGGMDWC